MRLAALVCCPRCRADLAEAGAGVVCTGCAHAFPSAGKIPILLAEPEPTLRHFRELARAFDPTMRAALDELLAQSVARESVLPATRARLETLHRELDRHRARILELLTEAGLTEDFGVGPLPAGPVLKLGSILEYFPQIHRDWGWDDAAGSEALEAVAEVSWALGELELGQLLVLGAGACRLTQELHHRHRATATLALDLNPFPFFVARKILAGEPVVLHEFPPWPRDSGELYVERTLASRCPVAASNLHLAFADALDPPVRPGAFDTILTPWFLDQAPGDVRRLVERISELLPLGGRWLNSGPLLYEQTNTAWPERYCADEVLEMVGDAGFRVVRERRRRLRYLESPIDSRGRSETVLTFCAEKQSFAGPRPVEELPPWASDPTLPVPLFSGVRAYQAEHAMFEAVIALVDGVRSITDIGEVMIRRHGLPSDAAIPAVQACLCAVAARLSRRCES